MSFTVNDPGRVGQSKYWTVFGANMIIVPLLIVGGVYALFTGNFALGILMILAVLPMGIYFRVTMMRRCRDIGWPAFLPWLLFGLQLLLGFSGSFRPALGQTPSLSLLAIPIMLGGIDFIFSIVIGCIASKNDYAGVFEPDEVDFRPSQPRSREALATTPWQSEPRQYAPVGGLAKGDEQLDSFDQKIARALEARRVGEQQPLAAQGLTAQDSGANRPVGGFGRRVI